MVLPCSEKKQIHTGQWCNGMQRGRDAKIIWKWHSFCLFSWRLDGRARKVMQNGEISGLYWLWGYCMSTSFHSCHIGLARAFQHLRWMPAMLVCYSFRHSHGWFQVKFTHQDCWIPSKIVGPQVIRYFVAVSGHSLSHKKKGKGEHNVQTFAKGCQRKHD